MTAVTAAPELVRVPPSTLFIDTNIRRVTAPDPTLVESIRDIGVRQPIVAVRNSEGGLLVRLGQRRTLAAIEAGDAPVPVFVAGPADSDDVARIVEQWAENEHRAPLVTSDRMAAIEQLSLLGVPADQIAKRTRASRAEVDHALTAADSMAARDAVEQHARLTLEHAAAIAEFDDHPDIAARLVDVAVRTPGSFAFEVKRAHGDLGRLAKVAAETQRLQDAGVTVVAWDRIGRWHDQRGKAGRRLDELEAPGGKKLNGTTHKSCPGHAAIVEHAGDSTFVCTDWKGNGHVDKYASISGSTRSTAAASEAEQEKARTERRRVIENNKAWPIAETVRREFVTGLLHAKSLSGLTDGAKFLAAELVHGDVLRADYMVGHIDGRSLAAELLGHANVSELAAAVARASEARAAVLALAVVLSKYEANTTREHWRTVHATTRRYLDFLESNGYELADVEKLAAARKLGRRPTKAAAK